MIWLRKGSLQVTKAINQVKFVIIASAAFIIFYSSSSATKSFIINSLVVSRVLLTLLFNTGAIMSSIELSIAIATNYFKSNLKS